MAIGRTFQESVQRRSGLEVGATGFDLKLDLNDEEINDQLNRAFCTPNR